MSGAAPAPLRDLASHLSARAWQALVHALPPHLAASLPPAPDPADADQDATQAEAGAPARPSLEVVHRAALGLVLTAAEPERAAALWRALSLPQLVDVVVWLVSTTPLGLTRGLEEADAAGIQAVRAELPGAGAWTLDDVAANLRQGLPGARLRPALAAAFEADAPAAAALQSQLYRFADLEGLTDVELQLVLARNDNPTVALALSGAPDTVARRLLGSISSRRASLVRDEAERYAGAEADEVERAQGRLVATARHLYEMGHVSTYLGSVPGPAAGAPPEAGGEPGDEEGGGPKAEAEAMTEPLPSQRPGRRRLWLATGLASAALAAAGVAGMVLGRGQASAPPQVVAGGSHGASGRLGAPVSGSGSRVAVGRARPAVPGARRLAPGEVLRTGDVDAVLEFSGRDPTAADAEGAAAVVEVSADSEVQRPDLPGEAPEESGDLYLRVGRVRVVVARGEFTVRTPVARLGAGAGAVFRVRVVLDGTSEVRVEEGVVALRPSQDPTVALALGPGQGRRVRPARQ